MSNSVNQDLLRIINYLPIREINAELKENEINNSELSNLESIKVYVENLLEEKKEEILSSYQFSICPLSIRLVKYRRSADSPLLISDLGDWIISGGEPIRYNDKIVYKLEKIGCSKVVKDGWELKEIARKDALLVIDRFNENILELRGPIRTLKSTVDTFSKQLKWEDYKILEFSDEELKNILDELKALVEEMQLDISAGQLLTSLRLSNKGNENGIDYNKPMKIIIGDEDDEESEIDLNQEATGHNYWFKNEDEDYTAYISKTGTFHTKNLLSEFQIEQIVNKILEVKYKTLMLVKASLLENENDTLFKLYKIFVNQTSYNSLARFSASYFAKRTNISNEMALKFLLELAKQGTIEIRYELICNICDRIVFSASSLEEIKKFASTCIYCGNELNSDEIDDTDINVFFKVKDVVNIPMMRSLTEKDKDKEDMNESILDIFKRIDEIEEECNDFFADREYSKIKENILVLESMKNGKALEMADRLKSKYKEIFN